MADKLTVEQQLDEAIAALKEVRKLVHEMWVEYEEGVKKL